jgi:hypothetical protein
MTATTVSATSVERAPEFYLNKQANDTWSNYFRGRRFALIEQKLRAIAAKKGECRIIDIGGRVEYWNPILPTLQDIKARITVINLEKTQPQPGAMFDFAYGNACDLSAYGDKSYDFAHSNSLIEHVGRWPEMQRCAAEISRVANSYYVQTPYLWFPIEPHFRAPFYAWLPEQTRAKLLMAFDLGYIGKAATLNQAMADVQSINLLDHGQMKALFPTADITFERVLGLPKSMIACRD